MIILVCNQWFIFFTCDMIKTSTLFGQPSCYIEKISTECIIKKKLFLQGLFSTYRGVPDFNKSSSLHF